MILVFLDVRLDGFSNKCYSRMIVFNKCLKNYKIIVQSSNKLVNVFELIRIKFHFLDELPENNPEKN
jgi:hypothetical protein